MRGESLLRQVRGYPADSSSLPEPLNQKIETMVLDDVRQPQDVVLQRADADTPLHLELVVYQYDDVAGPRRKSGAQ